MFRPFSLGGRRKAFTLVELLVVIAIIGVLVALLLPAVQAAREAARRTQCSNNLKQLGLGAQNMHDIRHYLPPNRLANNSTAKSVKWLTWAVIMLPYIEQKPYYDQWDETKPYQSHPVAVTRNAVATYFCPSRRRPNEAFSKEAADGGQSGGLSDYAACAGNGIHDGVNVNGVINPAANGAMICAQWTLNAAQNRIVQWKGLVRLATVTDGTSNTFLLGEKHVRRLNASGTRFVFGTADDRSVYSEYNHNNFRRFAGIGDDGVRYRLDSFTDAYSVQNLDNRTFGSRHPNVCQFVFCDGSVKPIPNNIDINTLHRLANKEDGMSIGDY
jgi:prepilin-type N-terminal cleavage/methylation domain-containing protein/prepilin-type processing-associated H-X9-DG protein